MSRTQQIVTMRGDLKDLSRGALNLHNLCAVFLDTAHILIYDPLHLVYFIGMVSKIREFRNVHKDSRELPTERCAVTFL